MRDFKKGYYSTKISNKMLEDDMAGMASALKVSDDVLELSGCVANHRAASKPSFP
jgi:hypothetical protein